MMNIKKTAIIFYLFLSTLILTNCAKPPAQPPKEAPPSATEVPPPAPLPTQPADSQDPEKLKAIPPPTLDEARSTVARVYKDVVSTGSLFTVGDFNGDGSQDIAVIVQPIKEKLPELNHELAGWLLRDARTDRAPEPMMQKTRDEPKSRPAVTERDELLLAVVHGYGPEGWRNPEAQISYLVKNAASGNLKAQAKKSVLRANKGRQIPPLIGDVINGTLAGVSGFVYYTGSSYGWYDPQNYQAEIAKRLPH
ncbi:MAG: FG-GAP repeat protein [Blastocatellia bacterium]